MLRLNQACYINSYELAQSKMSKLIPHLSCAANFLFVPEGCIISLALYFSIKLFSKDDTEIPSYFMMLESRILRSSNGYPIMYPCKSDLRQPAILAVDSTRLVIALICLARDFLKKIYS